MLTTAAHLSSTGLCVLRRADRRRVRQLVDTTLMAATLERCRQEPGDEHHRELRRHEPRTQARDICIIVAAGEVRGVKVVDGDGADLWIAVGRDLHPGAGSAH